MFLFLKNVGDIKDFIYKFQKEEMNKNKDNEFYDNIIDIEKYLISKKEDDLNEIFYAIEELKICTTMINYDMKSNKLINLKNIVDSSKQMDNIFDNKCNLDEKIHVTGLKLIKKGKIKNKEIQEFIKSDIFFQEKLFNHKIYGSL